MNVDDFKDVKLPEGDMLELIFNRQCDLMDKYHVIEEMNVGHRIPSAEKPNLTDVMPQKWNHAGALNINDRASQLRMKSFAWRITEEITEATEMLDGKTIPSETGITHYLEELIDALHFSVELLCLCGFNFTDFDNQPGYVQTKDRMKFCFMNYGYLPQRSFNGLKLQYRHTDIKHHCYRVIEKLGLAMNCLKLKEWKTTAVITDEKKFKELIRGFFEALIFLLSYSGFSADTCAKMYLQKNEVNKFRQRTNY